MEPPSIADSRGTSTQLSDRKNILAALKTCSTLQSRGNLRKNSVHMPTTKSSAKIPRSCKCVIWDIREKKKKRKVKVATLFLPKVLKWSVWSFSAWSFFELSSPSDFRLLLAIVQLVYQVCTLRITINYSLYNTYNTYVL